MQVQPEQQSLLEVHIVLVHMPFVPPSVCTTVQVQVLASQVLGDVHGSPPQLESVQDDEPCMQPQVDVSHTSGGVSAAQVLLHVGMSQLLFMLQSPLWHV